MKPFVVCAGHGGIALDGWGWKRDSGAVSQGYAEADLMADLRDRVVDDLRGRGQSVRTDGGPGINRALSHAMTLIAGSRVAVELHCNASTIPQATGIEVISEPAKKTQAQDLARSVADVLGLRLRGASGWLDEKLTAIGAKGYRLGFIARGGMILETMFITNPNDLSVYLERRQAVAKAIARALELA